MHPAKPRRNGDEDLDGGKEFSNKKEPPPLMCDCNLYLRENSWIKEFPFEYDISSIFPHCFIKEDIANRVAECAHNDDRNPGEVSLCDKVSDDDIEELARRKRDCTICNHEEKYCSITSGENKGFYVHRVRRLLYQV